MIDNQPVTERGFSLWHGRTLSYHTSNFYGRTKTVEAETPSYIWRKMAISTELISRWFK
jgi:hypothetical protein